MIVASFDICSYGENKGVHSFGVKYHPGLGDRKLSKEQAELLMLHIKEWFATHWRDNEHPTVEQAEVSFDYRKYPTVTFSN